MAAVPFCPRVLDGREWFTLTPGSSPGQALALSHRGRGGLIGVLCFSLGSRLRGNDGRGGV